jgi:hypothetical protein
MRIGSLRSELKNINRALRPIHIELEAEAQERKSDSYMPILERCNRSLRFLDQRRYCRTRPGISLDELESIEDKLKAIRADLLCFCGYPDGYGRAEIHHDHELLYELDKKLHERCLTGAERLKRDRIWRRLDALYTSNPENLARDRKNFLEKRNRDRYNNKTSSEQQELTRLEQLYPGAAPKYPEYDSGYNHIATTPSYFTPVDKFEERLCGCSLDVLADRYRLDLDLPILITCKEQALDTAIYGFKRIGFKDVDFSYDVEDGFGRSAYFGYGCVAIDETLGTQSGQTLISLLKKKRLWPKYVLVATSLHDTLSHRQYGLISKGWHTFEIAEQLHLLATRPAPKFDQCHQIH